jgi:hypothetical protein
LNLIFAFHLWKVIAQQISSQGSRFYLSKNSPYNPTIVLALVISKHLIMIPWPMETTKALIQKP